MVEPRAGETYRPPDYWSSLHHAAADLRAVGYPTLPLVFNTHLYANTARAVLHGLDAAGVSVRGKTVLDVGSGTGFWIDLWRREGAALVAGADLVPEAVERLRERFADADLTVADVAEEAPYPDRTFDVVTIMSVLHHVVEPERFARALANLATQLEAGGRLVVLDPTILRGRWAAPSSEGAHNVARPRAAWEEAAASAGLRIVSVAPAAAYLSEPVDAGSRAAFAVHRAWWRGFAHAIRGREGLAGVVVPPLAALDRWMLPRLRWGPAAKLLMLERTS